MAVTTLDSLVGQTMPFHPQHSLLNVNLDKMHTVDTRSVENLYGLWAVFSKASNVLEDGKRLENLTWRLWNRETFCCCPETKARSTRNLSSCKFTSHPTSASLPGLKTPELASSIDSATSNESCASFQQIARSTSKERTRPELTRLSSLESRTRGREKHITSCDLEKIVASITQQQAIEPLAELPPMACPASPSETVGEETCLPVKPASAASTPASLLGVKFAQLGSQTLRERRLQHTTPIIVEQPADGPRQRQFPQSSASTVLTQDSRTSSQTSESPGSPATSLSTHNIVRGFNPGGASSSYRSQTQLAPEPVPIKQVTGSSQVRNKKGACFMLGTSSESQDGSQAGSFQKHSLSTLARRLTHQSGSSLKQASLPDDALRTKVQSSPVFESDGEDDQDDDVDDVDDEEEDEDDDDIDDEDDDDEQDASDWEDEAGMEEDGSPVRDDGTRQMRLFQRVDSKPNLTSHRSLLTSMMHEGDRARELASQASRSQAQAYKAQASSSTPSATVRRQSPGQESKPQKIGSGIAQAQAINVPGSQGTLALSPRTTRRNMLSTELTESLRCNILWERQQKVRGSGSNANLKRRHTAVDVKKLSQQQQEVDNPHLFHGQLQPGEFNSNEYLHTGIEEYHAKGW